MNVFDPSRVSTVARPTPPPPSYLDHAEPCWHCSRKLQYVAGKGHSYRWWRGTDGHDHPVHLACWSELADPLARPIRKVAPDEPGGGE